MIIDNRRNSTTSAGDGFEYDVRRPRRLDTNNRVEALLPADEENAYEFECILDEEQTKKATDKSEDKPSQSTQAQQQPSTALQREPSRQHESIASLLWKEDSDTPTSTKSDINNPTTDLAEPVGDITSVQQHALFDKLLGDDLFKGINHSMNEVLPGVCASQDNFIDMNCLNLDTASTFEAYNLKIRVSQGDFSGSLMHISVSYEEVTVTFSDVTEQQSAMLANKKSDVIEVLASNLPSSNAKIELIIQ